MVHLASSCTFSRSVFELSTTWFLRGRRHRRGPDDPRADRNDRAHHTRRGARLGARANPGADAGSLRADLRGAALLLPDHRLGRRGRARALGDRPGAGRQAPARGGSGGVGRQRA